MPLFLFKCSECDCVVEKFFHTFDSASDAKVSCAECNGECFRQISCFKSKLHLDAKDLYEQKIKPEADAMCKKIANGSDRDFLDIYGEE